MTRRKKHSAQQDRVATVRRPPGPKPDSPQQEPSIDDLAGFARAVGLDPDAIDGIVSTFDEDEAKYLLGSRAQAVYDSCKLDWFDAVCRNPHLSSDLKVIMYVLYDQAWIARSHEQELIDTDNGSTINLALFFDPEHIIPPGKPRCDTCGKPRPAGTDFYELREADESGKLKHATWECSSCFNRWRSSLNQQSVQDEAEE